MTDLLNIQNDLHGALERGEFRLEYQPIVNVETNQICCCEALLRWHHPQHGRIAPDRFIPVAESTGLIVPIGAWVLREACAEAANWPTHVRIAVNVSGVQLRAPGLADAILGALARSGLDPNRLEVEITESVLLDEGAVMHTTLERIQAIGVRVALDDFGTGYCSLGYLRRFAFDKIKIDRSFTADMLKEDPHALAVMRAVVRLGSTLGVSTTVEGVETDEQLQLVRANGCTEAQGYLFGRPKSTDEIRKLLCPPPSRADLPIERSWSQARKLATRPVSELEAEEQRLRALYEYDVLDTPSEESFDRITRLAMRALQAPMAMVSLVDRDRQWFKSKQGCAEHETARNISFCTHAVQGETPLVVADALNDPRFRNSPLVTGAPHVRSYIGVPLRTPSGHNIGALCINDVQPRDVTQDQVEILEDLARLVIDELELRKLATTDSLTGAMSPRSFLAEGNREIERARGNGHEVGCILFDIDHFKAVNDTYGHGAGDAVLREIIATCQAEISGIGFIGRLGGEEFGVLLPQNSAETAEGVAEKLRAKIALLIVKYPPNALRVTASLGVASLVATDAGMKDLLARADTALYRAKDGGRNKVRSFDRVHDNPRPLGLVQSA